MSIDWQWVVMKNFAVNMTLVRRVLTGTPDAYGNDVYTDVMIQVPQCVFVPAGSSENLVFTDQVSQTDTIFFPPGVVVTALDAVIYNGDTYEIQGEPSYWTSPFSGRESPIRINVTRVTGVTI